MKKVNSINITLSIKLITVCWYYARLHGIPVIAAPPPFSASGLDVFLRTAESVKGLLGGGVDVLGCFLTQCNRIDDRHIEELTVETRDLLRIYNVRLLKTSIPRSANVETSHLRQRNLFGRSVLSAVATAYKKLVEEEIIPYVNNQS